MKTVTFLVSCAIAVALVTTYVALGGTSYEPTPVANPCAPRPHREPSGTDERLELGHRDDDARPPFRGAHCLRTFQISSPGHRRAQSTSANPS